MATTSEPVVWTTRDGRELLPHQFEDGHLLNTITFINNNIKGWDVDNWDDDYDFGLADMFVGIQVAKLERVRDALIDEAKRRGIYGDDE